MFPRQFQALTEGVVLVGSHLLLQKALIEVDMAVDIRRHHQIPARIYLLYSLFSKLPGDSGNASTRNANIPGPRLTAQARIANNQVHQCLLSEMLNNTHGHYDIRFATS